MIRLTFLTLVLVSSVLGDSSAASGQDAPNPELAAAKQAPRFQRAQFVVELKRGRSLFDGKSTKSPLADFPEQVALIEAFDNVEFASNAEFLRWLGRLKGPRTYVFDTAVWTAEDGSEILRPLVLMTDAARAEVDESWRLWVNESTTAAQEKLTREQTSQAERDRLEATAQITRRTTGTHVAVATSLAAIGGQTSVWDLELVRRGNASLYGFGYGAAFAAASSFGQ